MSIDVVCPYRALCVLRSRAAEGTHECIDARHRKRKACAAESALTALKELKYVNPFTGTHKAGNHAFRRFRNTYLRNYRECPEGLYKYWMGHAGKDMSDLYDKIKEDVAFRRKWAERCGFGSS